MFKPAQLTLDHGRIGASLRTRFIETEAPRFGWSVESDVPGAKQTACRVRVYGTQPWDSGWVDTAQQHLNYAGEPLPRGEAVPFDVTLRDSLGNVSETARETLYLAQADWKAAWIDIGEDISGKTVYLRREISIQKPLRKACLYACGIGYHQIWIDGEPLDTYALEPANTDFTKTCQYVMTPELQDTLLEGRHCIGALLGEGWRRPSQNPYILSWERPFFGEPVFSCMLHLLYQDGEEEWVCTDSQWQAGRGAHETNSLFVGEVYNAQLARPWCLPGYRGFSACKVCDAPGGVMKPMLIPPICEHRTYKAIMSWRLDDGSLVMDFGQNLAGVARLRLPETLAENQALHVFYTEELDEDGTLYTETLREAKAEDVYIAAGGGRDPALWQPIFTYHGFRYVRVQGDGGMLSAEDVEAVELHTAMELQSDFRCGSALATKIHDICVQTEHHNAHSILTDCPQRDERQGWMNDATVRFESVPFSMDIGRMFPKIIRDIRDTQLEAGSIRCTAPAVFGKNPADPVCSSFLIAGIQAMLHTGNLSILEESYEAFCAWTNFLLSRTENLIVDYSYYGDWAAPQYACAAKSRSAVSGVTPGEFMSTGYLYFNCKSLAQIAAWRGDRAGEKSWRAQADAVRKAMLDKWYHAETATMATGSQACQAFSLWLGILPQEDRKAAAKKMRDDLLESGYRFTTGNLCTRYLIDMLTEYGYVDDAWTLVTKETYPSFGYMLQQEATTVWERFELKKHPGMNSHSHPMYGAADEWFWRYIAGIRPTQPEWTAVSIRPYFPEKLLSAQATVDTVKGKVSVRWTKRYGAVHLHAEIPFGMTAEVNLNGEIYTVGKGFHAFHQHLENEPEGSFAGEM